MSTTGFSYDYVFDLALRLPPEEQDRLLRELPNGVVASVEEPQESRLTDEYIKQHGIPMDDRFVLVTVPGKPIVSRAEIEEIRCRNEKYEAKRSPEELETKRQKLLELLLDCPVLTEEELKGFEEARREINECRLAYL